MRSPLRLLLGSRVHPSFVGATRTLPATIVIVLSVSCGEGLPSIPLDLTNHDQCSASGPPYVVDASASEIQCLVEDYLYINNADEADPISEAGMNVPGPPACCEVCARKDTADDACKAMCKHELCTRAQDEHYAVGEELGTCVGLSCGFSFDSCMNTGLLHIQQIDLLDSEIDDDPAYGLRTKCRANATDPVRPDGLFRYLEGLGAIPGAGGGLANVEDVVEYCQEKLPSDTGEEPPATTYPGNGGADSTGTAELVNKFETRILRI